MNWEACDCSTGVGVTGEEAVMEWRRVQEERPRSSTSGGQSAGGATGRTPLGVFFEAEKKSAEEVQVRQL